MDVRIFAFSCLLLGVSVVAQVEPDRAPAGQAPAGQAPAGQNPAGQAPVSQEPRVKTPAEQLTELAREKERLEKEVAFAKERQAAAKKDLAAKLGQREQQLRSVRFEAPKPAMPVSQPIRKARLMSETERAAQSDDVLMLVNGEPIRRGQIELLTKYLRDAGVPGDESLHTQRVAFELIRNTAVLAAFPENPAQVRMAEALAALQQGKKVGDLVEQFGVVPGAAADGTVEVTRNSFLGVGFEQVAFSLEPGQVSRPFVNPQGFVIVQAIERKKTDDGSDIAKVAALQIPFDASAEELRAAQAAPAMGQIELVVRDEATLAMLPALYRPTPVQPVAPGAAVDLGHDGEQAADQKAADQKPVKPVEAKPAGETGDPAPQAKPPVKPAQKGGGERGGD
jgi:parvulin-like peptidyl-prolyl isomerase